MGKGCSTRGKRDKYTKMLIRQLKGICSTLETLNLMGKVKAKLFLFLIN
jgi:hypothetical protein